MTKFIENLKVSGTRSNMLCHNSGKIRPSTTSNFYFLFLLKLMIIPTKIYRNNCSGIPFQVSWGCKITIPPLRFWTLNKRMPESVIVHMASDFSQVLYPPVFDTTRTIYKNCEWDVCVWLIVNNLLAL